MDYDGKDGPSSPSGGVKAMPIATRFQDERERLAGGFTDADRAWRKKYLDDMNLHPKDGIEPPWFYRERYNPIRRAYMFPLNFLFKPLKPRVSQEFYLTARVGFGRALIGIGLLYIGAYWVKYNGSHWTKIGGWTAGQSHPTIYPGSSEPLIELGQHPGDKYYDLGFKQSPI